MPAAGATPPILSSRGWGAFVVPAGMIIDMNTGKSAAGMLAAAVAIVAIVVGAVVVLQLHGKDISPLLTVVTILVLPLLGALGAVKLGEIHQGTANVQQQTNGNTTKLLDLVEKLSTGQQTTPAAPATLTAAQQLPTLPQ